jgi:hypothetical protein
MARKSAKSRAQSKPSNSGPAAAAAPADDVSASDPAAAHFFSAPPVTYDDYHPEIVDAVAESVPRRAPANPERRRRLTRVVAGAVALSCAICVAAAVRVATVHAETTRSAPAVEVAIATPPSSLDVVLPGVPGSPSTGTSPPSHADPVAAPVPESPVTEAPTAAKGPAAAEAPTAAEAPPAVEARPAVEAPVVAAESARPAVDPPAVAAAAEAQPAAEGAPAEVDPVAAREAKRASQRSLDRGDAKASIEAGEQSVALDPSDAEAWLILGAAYQARGAYSEGRRCFSTCARVAKRGPRGECGALAH